MKHFFKKRVLSFLLLLAVFVTLFPVRKVDAAEEPTAPILKETEYRKLLVGQSYDFNIANYPAKAVCKWSSSNTKVASVNKYGYVKAEAQGTSLITCVITKGEEKYTLNAIVEVRKPSKNPASQLMIHNKIEIMAPNSTYDLNRTYLPKNASDFMNWTSSDTSIAKVDCNGVVSALKTGKVTITATSINNGASDQVAIVVAPEETVYTKRRLECVLKNKLASKIVFESNKAIGDIIIEEGDYSDVELEINAPKASVYNSAVFKKITITAIKPNSFHEFAKGNEVFLNASTHVFIDEESECEITIQKENINVNVECNGNADIMIDKKCSLSLHENSKKAPNIAVNAEGADISLAAGANLTLNAKATLSFADAEAVRNTEIRVESLDFLPTIVGGLHGETSLRIVLVHMDTDSEQMKETRRKIEEYISKCIQVEKEEPTYPVIYVTPAVPVATPTKPAATPTKPAATPTKPAATPTEPAATPTEPAATPTDPKITPTEPEITPTDPKITPTEPEITPTDPKITPTEPEITPTDPKITPTEPEITPTDPKITPTDPEITPTVPEEKYVQISFDSNGGSVEKPLSVKAGSKVSKSLLPVPTKDRNIFISWFVDDKKSMAFDESVVIDKDITLYADYTEYSPIILYEQDETLLLSQPSDVSFIIEAKRTVTVEEVQKGITLSAISSRVTPPSITVSSLGGNRFRVSPTSDYEAGDSYIISVTEPLRLLANVNNDQFLVKKITFGIYSENIHEAELNSAIINLIPEDYLAYNSDVIHIKSESAVAKGVQEGSILSVEDSEGKIEYYKAGTVTKEGSSYIADLLACELTDVYSNLLMVENRRITADELMAFAMPEEEILSAVKNNQELRLFRGLVAAAVDDYAVSKQLKTSANTSSSRSSGVSDVKFDVSFNKYTEGGGKGCDPAQGAKATITSSFRVNINKNTYAKVTMEASQDICVDSGGKIEVYLDAIITENTTYDIDYLTILRSITTFQMNIVLSVDGTTYDIKDDIEGMMAKSDTDGFVGLYRKNLDIDGDMLKVLDIQIFRLSFPVLGILEIGIPVSFRVHLDIKTPFYTDFECRVEKGYRITGTQDSGLSNTVSDRVTRYRFKQNSLGYLGVKAGVAVGIEISFKNLSKVGKIGLEIEVGAYFDYYGYGAYELNVLKVGSINQVIETNNSVYYLEFGIYLDLNFYIRSKVFKFDKTYNLLEVKFPLLTAGDRIVPLYFVNGGTVKVNTSQENVNLLELGQLKLKYIDLVTGEFSEKNADPEDFYIVYYNSHITYDKASGELILSGNFQEKQERHDTNVYFAYNGKEGNIDGNIAVTLDYTFLPESVHINPEDVDKMCHLKFIYDGTVIHEQDILIGTALKYNTRQALLNKIKKLCLM